MQSAYFRRVNILTGHNGCGKTNFAVNLALDFKAQGKNICLIDLDIVNPYFRAADSKAMLEAQGIPVYAPVYANTNLDIPALTPAIYRAVGDRSRTLILDVGGDDAGAVALGQFSKALKSENDFAMFYLINQRRTFTQTPADAAELLREIEQASNLHGSALINSTNLAEETEKSVISASLPFAGEVARLTGLPIAFTLARRDLAGTVESATPVYPVDIYVKKPWEK